MTDLLADERRRVIMQHLRQTGMVRVVELAGVLAVAEETVRRDLKLLDEQGLLVRTHGGAVRSKEFEDSPVRAIEVPFELRRRAMMSQKQAIAREAVARIKGPVTIALDGSTTAWELASQLTDSELTVVTNSLMVITLLGARADGPRVISMGGSLDTKLMTFGGMIALDALRHVHLDIFFGSCGGIDPIRGFSEPSETSAQLKRQLLQMADRTIILADSTKFQSRSSVLFGAPEDVHELITDSDAPDAAIERLTASGMLVTRLAGEPFRK